jgi:hypothetical protein
MTTKGKAGLWLVTALAAFLLGFAPQYLQKERLRSDLAAANQRALSAEQAVRMGELRDLCGLMLMEVLRQNYGIAKDYAARYFDSLGAAAGATDDAARKKGLEELLTRRDAVTALLAQGDPASAAEAQSLYARTSEVTGSR